MKVALFGGSFDPVHIEHVRLVRAAIDSFGLDKVIVMPSFVAPHKKEGAHASGEDRLSMCKLAFQGEEKVEVSDFELSAKGTSYTYLTCRAFKERFPFDLRYFLVGADMLEDFFTWKEPDSILNDVTLLACARESEEVFPLHERFKARFSKDFLEFPFRGEAVSSTSLRVGLALREIVFKELPIPSAVLEFLNERGLYRLEEARALLYEKPSRREHSYNVAKLACARARSLKIPEEKALLAATLHDCGKEILPPHPLLEGGNFPEAPAAVLHQFTGAYLAEHVFSVKDEDVLNAVRYHTSGRAGMKELEKLIYLSDLLEEGRSFPGVQALRALFFEDLDLCLERSLREQIEYLKRSKKPVYPLTEEALSWISEQNRRKKPL